MRALLSFLIVLLGLAAVGAYFSFFIVHQTQQAMVLQLGEVKKNISKPGLYWRIPFVQSVEYFDKRILELDAQPQRVISNDSKYLVVDAFMRYRINDPLKYYQAVRTETRARHRLSAVLSSSLLRVLGRASLVEVIRDKREELMRLISEDVNKNVKSLGMEVVDVRIKRADLPEANSEKVYERMRAERQREAAEFRAQGEEKSRELKAEANRAVTVLIAEAERKSQILRGEGDAERNRIFAEAYGKDPDFFAFYRSMQAYERGLSSSDTRLVISPNTDFFKFFRDPTGGTKEAPK